jgi:hypothetical protein
LVAQHGVKVVMIDYLQLIEPVTKRGQETDFAAEVAKMAGQG